MLSRKHNMSLTWNFSATSHGKGTVDGVGTTLKRQAMEKVQTNKVVVNNADEFYQAVQDSNIMVTLMNTTELQKYSNEKLKTLLSNSTAIHRIAGFHYIEQTENRYITKKYSSQVPHIPVEVNVKEPDYNNTSPTALEVGYWYTFFLEKYQYWFIRIVLEIKDNDQVKVDFLQQLTQLKNRFDSKVEVEVVTSQSTFF